MSKLVAVAATLKAILIAASIAFACGEILPVILISVLFNLAQLGAKPVGQTVPRDNIVISSGILRSLATDCRAGKIGHT